MFYSLLTITLNLLIVVCSLLMICSLYCPESLSVMFLMVRDPVSSSRCCLSLNFSSVLFVLESILAMRLFSAPNVQSKQIIFLHSSMSRESDRISQHHFLCLHFTLQQHIETGKFTR